MALTSISEYAKNKGVVYEAIRKQIAQYKNHELKDHIVTKGRKQLLDEYAVEFLDQHRRESSVVVYREDLQEENQRLNEQNQNLLLKVATLQEELLKEKDTVKMLQSEKIELLESEKKEWKPFFGKWEIRKKEK